MNLDVLISNAVRRFGDRAAISDGKISWTYREIDARLNRLGNSLMAMGLRPQDRIASLQANTIGAFELDLMSARFGFVRTLLNARAGLDDFAYVIEHSKAKALVFGAEFAPIAAALRERVPTLEHLVAVGDGPRWAASWDDFARTGAPSPPAQEVAESDWHSIYYTSGTTGRPKGVVLSQRNWIILVRNHLIDVVPKASPEDVLLHAAPMSHASGALVFAHFVRGARQVVLPRFEAAATLEAIARERVTTTFLAPTMIHMVLEHPDHECFDKRSLHSVIYGGAPMAVEHVKETVRRWGPVLIQGYGQWEAPQIMTVLDQAQHVAAIEDPALAHRLASAGLPLSFVRIGIMNDQGRLLPPGEDGEVVTAGDHLMVGYLDNAEATAAERVGPWQRTGDIGRIDRDGFVYLTDRKKDLIITGGSNVYPREIEEVLYTHPDVLEALAIGVPDEKWGERVHALVVARPDRRIEEEPFLTWCRERLGPDKRPRSLELVADLPKSAYGKILRREVRARYWQGRERRI